MDSLLERASARTEPPPPHTCAPEHLPKNSVTKSETQRAAETCNSTHTITCIEPHKRFSSSDNAPIVPCDITVDPPGSRGKITPDGIAPKKCAMVSRLHLRPRHQTPSARKMDLRHTNRDLSPVAIVISSGFPRDEASVRDRHLRPIRFHGFEKRTAKPGRHRKNEKTKNETKTSARATSTRTTRGLADGGGPLAGEVSYSVQSAPWAIPQGERVSQASGRADTRIKAMISG